MSYSFVFKRSALPSFITNTQLHRRLPHSIATCFESSVLNPSMLKHCNNRPYVSRWYWGCFLTHWSPINCSSLITLLILSISAICRSLICSPAKSPSVSIPIDDTNFMDFPLHSARSAPNLLYVRLASPHLPESTKESANPLSG
nr:hypothetical protein Iba_chr05bCG5710 [Ipomoea batatas]